MRFVFENGQLRDKVHPNGVTIKNELHGAQILFFFALDIRGSSAAHCNECDGLAFTRIADTSFDVSCLHILTTFELQ